ncbi:hypothetical protein ABW21_db0209340 [Orbilia brochopaga]|nr:hypothetical protein ABW21_db0209340 [Drechslerella brochopaga]
MNSPQTTDDPNEAPKAVRLMDLLYASQCKCGNDPDYADGHSISCHFWSSRCTTPSAVGSPPPPTAGSDCASSHHEDARPGSPDTVYSDDGEAFKFTLTIPNYPPIDGDDSGENSHNETEPQDLEIDPPDTAEGASQ